jgi:hypothetical protein
MFWIAHRGNISGARPLLENSPDYIQQSIDAGYMAEIDLWRIDQLFYLGHDDAQYSVELSWLEERKDHLWVHCKNINALEALSSSNLHYFWHEQDTVTLTSKGYIWAFPGNQPIVNSIAVMPEIHNEIALTRCAGICSDNIEYYKYLLATDENIQT